LLRAPVARQGLHPPHIARRNVDRGLVVQQQPVVRHGVAQHVAEGLAVRTVPLRRGIDGEGAARAHGRALRRVYGRIRAAQEGRGIRAKIDLLWATAPPRMPINRPTGAPPASG